MGCKQSHSTTWKPRPYKGGKRNGKMMVNRDHFKDFIENTRVKPKHHSLIKDNYKIEKTLGKGAYSVVKLGSFLDDPSKVVSIKSMDKNLKNQNLKSTIVHEMHVLSKLDHPSIIKYHEWYENDDTIDAVLEYSPGESLDVILKSMEGGLTSDKLVIMFLVAKAVAYLKHKNVVHRDLKPANIIVNWDESLELGWSVQLIDFGFAKDDNRDKNLCGSPKFMAPEALLKKSGHSSDVWSLGIIFYHIISGYFPFAGDDASELFEAISLDYLDFCPKALWEYVPFEAIDLITKMLEKNPDKRISIEEVLTHNCFKTVHRISKNSELSGDEIEKINAYSKLPKLTKKFLEYSVRFVDSEYTSYLKEKFVFIDNENLGYIPVFGKNSKKLASTKNMSVRLRSNSDWNTLATMQGHSSAKVAQAPTFISYSGFIAALVDPELLCSQTIASMIYNIFNSKNDEQMIQFSKFKDSTFFSNEDSEAQNELAALLGASKGISKEWLSDYLTSISEKLVGSD